PSVTIVDQTNDTVELCQFEFLMYIELVSFTSTFHFGDMANCFLHYSTSCHVHLAGANYVSVIQMTDVGLGICGLEGRQVVMASDFVMEQFCFVKKSLIRRGTGTIRYNISTMDIWNVGFLIHHHY
uniref:Uncharacterized protein n=4 Tax=Aegilops tauschii subsp. strangulata TaxID=200361 RepID=A0A453K5P8_AEGTS